MSSCMCEVMYVCAKAIKFDSLRCFYWMLELLIQCGSFWMLELLIQCGSFWMLELLIQCGSF